MDRNELEGLVSVYEGGFEQIQSILDDGELTSREKLDAIGDVVLGDDESEDDDERGE